MKAPYVAPLASFGGKTAATRGALFVGAVGDSAVGVSSGAVFVY